MGNYIAPYIFDDKKTVLSSKYSAGPMGLGDPEDKSLRKVEKDVLIQRIISERARNEYCRVEMTGECFHSIYPLGFAFRASQEISSTLITEVVKEQVLKPLCCMSVALTDCARDKYISMLWTCRPQSKALQVCLEKAYYDEDLKEQCTNEYLERRSEYRRTGIKKESKEKYGPKVFLPPANERISAA